MITRRWMPAALIASLAVNMFLGGLLIAHSAAPPPQGPAHFLERMAQSLPTDDAAILRKAMASHQEELAAEQKRHEEMPGRVEAALLAEPFDPQALIAVFSDNDGQEQRTRRQLQQALAVAVATMSPEGRRRMAAFHP